MSYISYYIIWEFIRNAAARNQKLKGLLKANNLDGYILNQVVHRK